MNKLYFIVILCILLVILSIIALGVGSYNISSLNALKLIFSNENTNETLIIFQTRLPRIISAIVVGASLAMSGALYQGVIANPLVSPGILGVLSGASFGAALAMVLGFSTIGIEILCFICGILAMCVSLFLSMIFDKNKSILMLILGGIISSSFFGAGVSVIKILADPYNTLPNIVFWLMGSLAFIKELPLIILSLFLIFALIFCILSARVVDILNLDYESAMSLGINVKRTRLIFILIATFLASASVALGGLIGWVGLVMPHIARFIIGANHRLMLPFCALFGACFLLICDTLARSMTQTELPIGILTSVFGIPIFASILFINKKKALQC
ncbi:MULTISPECIES: FecCD family ABC transporter permease [unclassified Campylobacter]|uniref:FecCD family ABC transporter permease n=1 Tax=unclassified Campylobacter TaxID=2593542 RepID=UPI0012381CBF|nr:MULTISPECIES: iron ABC transporter permease [unclassified Campylobacter]KAA6224875.1 iron ABC transporter permease [Campylobacter sp. LR185c]KAA6226340.1 iron ABC transporter permease [Campylobacter sp. LR286c]KAA6226832.1 iron ABC transporter permease [Campylobacter sp. LR196d]KAA6230269.1 iron ABC transporter permease [Campylobacter sp. LR291e]KAA6233790.1 iron ABC transporter permease [Campylobacter sp. LR264d]